MENCCESFIKYIIFFFNFLLAFTGLALIGIGAYVHIEANSYLDFLSTSYVNTPIVFIVIGVILFVVSFFGCCGSLFENRCMIYTYVSLLIVILLAEVGAGISAYLLQDNLTTEIPKQMTLSMVNYGKPGYGGVTTTWDFVQKNLKCCGVSDYKDWEATLQTNLPASCCSGPSCNVDNVYPEGCLSMVESVLVQDIHLVAVGGIAIAFIQFIMIIFSCCIGQRTGRSRGRDKHYLRA